MNGYKFTYKTLRGPLYRIRIIVAKDLKEAAAIATNNLPKGDNMVNLEFIGEVWDFPTISEQT